MGLLSRASTIFKAKVSKVLDAAEDPRETLDYSYEKQLELLQKVKRGLADIVTARKGLEMQAARLEADIERLEADAAAAVRQGRDDLATQALERKAEEGEQLADLRKQIEGLKQEEDKMADNERRLSLKIQTFRTQKEVIKAQYSSAEAQVKIGEATTGISEEMADVGLALERARDRTERMRARAGAIEDLTAKGALTDALDGNPGEGDLERQLRATRQKDQVAADLARLKAQMGSQGGGGV
ncbi:MAG: PspA/IM30 family protein [Firmicutes bacterium]|nr:PspA/IM30 family protein [Bacillota bacterium]